jgi:glycoside/pentoside/hexuronide:cation symporter, GPH family
MKPLSTRQLFAYAGFSSALAMAALPIYMFVPQFYAQHGLALEWVGSVLFGVRLLIAFVDPLLGNWIDHSNNAYQRFILISLPVLLIGYLTLLHPPDIATLGRTGLAMWFVASLTVLYLGYSIGTIAHQSWGAALAPQPSQRARISGAREGCALLGVMVAAALFGSAYLSVVFCVFLGLGAVWLLKQREMRLAPPVHDEIAANHKLEAKKTDWRLPFLQARFRGLFAVLIVNGFAAAIPGTLFLFFVRDRLQAGSHISLFLILFFGTAALSIAGWVRLARRWGEARSWMLGMVWAVLIGVWSYFLPPDSVGVWGFAIICALSGFSLGADLALPAALLTGVISASGHSNEHEAAYFGVWNWGVQLTLALSAGICLPLLSWSGYVPGQGLGLTNLAIAYALIPCVLKLTAAAMLWRFSGNLLQHSSLKTVDAV